MVKAGSRLPGATNSTPLNGRKMSHRIYSLVLTATLLLIVLATTGSAFAAPPETLKELSEAVPDSVSLEGQVVYVDFWASWCVPCRSSFPWMKTLYDKYEKQGLEIIAVCVDKDHEAAARFLAENPAPFPVVFDSTGHLAELYELEAMPTSFLYNRSGELVSQHRGFRKEESDDLATGILELLAKEKPQ